VLQRRGGRQGGAGFDRLSPRDRKITEKLGRKGNSQSDPLQNGAESLPTTERNSFAKPTAPPSNGIN